MNYVNTTIQGTVDLFLNLKITTELGIVSALDWTMTKDGSDVPEAKFNTPSTNYNLLANNGYSQKLSADFWTAGDFLENNAFYALKATLDGVVVYRGKVFATDVNASAVSIHNKTKYIKNSTTNEYTIIN